jgi:hypothetical protein
MIEYRVVTIQDVNPVSGQDRKHQIHIPATDALMVELRSDLQNLENKFPIGWANWVTHRQGRSTIDNVFPHWGNRFLYQIDLQGAYGQIRSVHVVAGASLILERLDASLDPIDLPEDYFNKYFLPKKLGGGLPVGSPTSPYLFNIGLVPMMVEFYVNAVTNGMVVTQYLDDITISSQKPITPSVKARIRKIVCDHRFTLSVKKGRYVDLSKQTAIVTGIGLGRDRCFVPRRYLETLRGLLHKAMTDPETYGPQVAGRISVVLNIVRLRAKLRQAGHFCLPASNLERQILNDWWTFKMIWQRVRRLDKKVRRPPPPKPRWRRTVTAP